MKNIIVGLLLLCLLSISIFLGGCNTVRGMGEDIEAGGEAIQNAAK